MPGESGPPGVKSRSDAPKSRYVAPTPGPFLTPAVSGALRRQALLDLAERARGGVVIHLVLWLLLGSANGIAQTLPVLFWTQAALFAAVLLVRLAFERRVAALAAERPAAHLAFMAMLLCNPLQWGLLGAWAALWPPLRPVQEPILFILTGLAAAAGMGLAIDRFVRLAYPLLVMAPMGLTMALVPGTRNLYVAGAALVFVFYVVRASKVVHDDYWAAARARADLEDHARQLERMSITDGLTQVHNRQFLDRQLGIEWARAERDSQALSLLMIDIDHFKRVNDLHGHPFGDTCLQAVAQALQGALRRPGDLVARYGGEEFAVLLPGIDSVGAMLVAARMQEAVAALALQHDGRQVAVTCSIGVHSVASRSDCSVGDVISSADQALYAAKREGRNRVVASVHRPH
jgi:diguanylate cyclase (GGDEF)-like protein